MVSHQQHITAQVIPPVAKKLSLLGYANVTGQQKSKSMRFDHQYARGVVALLFSCGSKKLKSCHPRPLP